MVTYANVYLNMSALTVTKATLTVTLSVQVLGDRRPPQSEPVRCGSRRRDGDLQAGAGEAGTRPGRQPALLRQGEIPEEAGPDH